ncbi:MAG: sodium:solute symporter family protein [Woeseiaceae bacterium]|nr:sodium:solute symporter family protein [Woeseiaceae bacterium]
MNAYALAIGISLVVYIAIGNYAGRKVKHLADYYVAGRNAPTFLIVGTLVASVVSTNSFLGDVGFAYSGYAIPLVINTALGLMGYVLGALFFGRYIRRARANTVPEFFGNRFVSRRVRVFTALTVILGAGGYLIAVTQGVAMVITWVTDFTYVPALIAVWLGYTAFTIYSGSRGVILTDTLMFLLFASVGVAAVFHIIDAAGGWFTAVERLANFEPRPGIIGTEGYTGPGGNWTSTGDIWTWAIMFGIGWGVVFAISPWQSSRYLMARNEHVVIRAGCIAILVMSVLWTTIYMSGPVIALLNPDVEPHNNAMIWAANNAMPTAIGATLLAGIVAAGLSSASTFLTLIGFSISNDVMADTGADDARRLKMSRITILGVGIVVLVLAMLLPPDVFWITWFVAVMFAAVWGPVAFLSVWSKRITEAGAFWGLVAGFTGYAVPRVMTLFDVVSLPALLDPLFIGFVVGLATVLVVSARTTPTEAEKQYLAELHQPPPELLDAAAARRTLILPRFIIAWGIFLSAVMIVIYTRPYQLATGAVTEGGPYVVLNGELIIALAFGGLISAGGVLAYWAMRKLYA